MRPTPRTWSVPWSWPRTAGSLARAQGLGSNVLVKDGGFPGVVIRMGKGLDRFEMKGGDGDRRRGDADADPGTPHRRSGVRRGRALHRNSRHRGRRIYMNAGCHGAEFAEIVTEVTLMDPKGKVKQLSRKQISFKYRSSNIEGIVLEAKLAWAKNRPPS